MKPYLLVSGDFVPTGGMDRANLALACGLAGRGHHVHLVTHRADAELTNRLNVTVHRVPKPVGSYFLGEPLLRWAGRRWARRIAGQGGRVLVNGGNCFFGDVNWVHYVHAADRSPVRGGPLRRFKAWWTRRSGRAAERRALRQARFVLANSDRTRRDLLELLDLPSDRVRTVYYGTDPDRFRPISAEERLRIRRGEGWPESRPVAVFVGGLGDRRKGFDRLFAAWRRLCLGEWDVDLVVIGSGAELPAWQARAEGAGLTDRIRFLGFRRDVPDLLPACDLLVAPTRYEAYGLGVHEALCCGIPALVSRTAGVAEHYPAELADFLLDDPEDDVDLARRLLRWRTGGRNVHTTLAALTERLRGRTWDVMVAEMLGLLESGG
jgi:glycosyltransferase involved in cell wall biosynthesis